VYKSGEEANLVLGRRSSSPRAILLLESSSGKSCFDYAIWIFRLICRTHFRLDEFECVHALVHVVHELPPRFVGQSDKWWYKVIVQNGDKPRLLLDSIVLGIVGALSAQLFMWMLRLSQKAFLVSVAGYRPPGLPEEGGVLREVVGPHGLWLVPVATTLGGLISGALVYGLAPETEGHGTDTVVKALHWTGGVIRARVAPVKMLASAITIGSGGSAGREGPAALIAAGLARYTPTCSIDRSAKDVC
jgi:hypothetical protein